MTSPKVPPRAADPTTPTPSSPQLRRHFPRIHELLNRRDSVDQRLKEPRE